MAAQVITSAVIYLSFDTKLDYNDANRAQYSTVTLRFSGRTETYTFLVPSANLAGILNNAPATVTLSQGQGVLNTTVAI